MNEVLGYYTDVYGEFVPVITGPARNIVHGLREFKRLQKREYEQQVTDLCEENR